MKLKTLGLGLVMALSANTAMAAENINTIENLAQDEFAAFSEDMGAVLSYKALAPAEPLGITGFDVGIELTATSLANSDIMKRASDGNSMSTIPVPKVHIHKGLPLNIDVGAFMSTVPNSNIKLVGAELRYAFLEGGVALPAVALRGTYTQLSGVDQLDFNTMGAELTISKGFLMLTPYGGVGLVNYNSMPNKNDDLVNASGLKDESGSLTKIFVGMNANLGLMNFALEGDQTGDATTYGLKVGLRF